mgnify:CR=1 FL=1
MNQIIVRKNYDFKNVIEKIEYNGDDITKALRLTSDTTFKMPISQIEQEIANIDGCLNSKMHKQEIEKLLFVFIQERINPNTEIDIEQLLKDYYNKIKDLNHFAIYKYLKESKDEWLPKIITIANEIEKIHSFHRILKTGLKYQLTKKLADKKEEEERQEILSDTKTLKQRQDAVARITKGLKK